MSARNRFDEFARIHATELALNVLHVVRRCRGVDQDRLALSPARAIQSITDLRPKGAGREGDGVDAEGRKSFGDGDLHLALGRARTGTGEDRGLALGRVECDRSRMRHAAAFLRDRLRASPIATPEPPVISGMSAAARADRAKMLIGNGIDDHDPMPRGLLARECFADSLDAGLDILERDKADRERCLPLKHAHEVRIPHGRQRVILHAALVQRHAVDEQMALINRSAIGGKGRAGEGEVAAGKGEKRFGDMARYCPRRSSRRWSNT